MSESTKYLTVRDRVPGIGDILRSSHSSVHWRKVRQISEGPYATHCLVSVVNFRCKRVYLREIQSWLYVSRDDGESVEL